MTCVTDRAEKLEAMEREAAISMRVRYVGISALTCEECEEAIPQARRDVLPGIYLCVECAGAAEQCAR